MLSVMKIKNEFEHIENTINQFCPIKELDRVEKELYKNFATKDFVQYIKDEIGEFVKREELALLKNDGEE